MTAAHRIFVPLAPEQALQLFTPVGEREWAPHWAPVFPAGEHGDGAAPGTVFLTGGTHWVVVDRAADRIRYARVTPGVRAGTVEVRLAPHQGGAIAEVTYEMTAIALDDEFEPALHDWEPAIAAALAARQESRA
jgi:hypothetical protein